MKDSIDNKAVVYARYSSRGQNEQSIEGQIAAAQKYAASKGYTIIKEYCDRAKTGTNDNREAFQQMLSDCAKKQFRVIIVWKVDRFGRNREEITFNKYRAKKNGVRVEYVAESLPGGPEGVILESVLEGMAEYYSLQLSQNVRRGLMETAKKHHIIGGRTPLGYKSGPDGEYLVDDQNADVVRQIFSKYASGMTMQEVVDWLNKNGYRTAEGKVFNKNSLPRMLSNERYIGTYIYKDLIWEENAIPAIIDRETFGKVQEMLKMNRRAPSHRWSYSDYILTDKMFCGLCGSPMIGESGYSSTGKKHSYYSCAGHKNPAKGVCRCPKKPVRQDTIEAEVFSHVWGILRNEDTLNWIADLTWDYYQKEQAEDSELKALQKRRQDIEKGISNLVRSIELGIINDAIQSRIETLTAEKEQVEAEIAGRQLRSGPALTRDHILFFLQKMGEGDQEDEKVRRRIIETFVNSIYLYKDHMVIAYNFGGQTEKITLGDIPEEPFECDCISRG